MSRSMTPDFRRPEMPRRLSTLWDAPHRPLFLMSFLCALVVIAWWPLGRALGLLVPLADPVSWHVHELLFGFALAAVGGYGLTALPGWTATAPLRGLPLFGLAGAWLGARFAVTLSGTLPLPGLVLINAGYPLALALVLWRAWHGAPRTGRRAAPALLAVAVLCLGMAQAAFLITTQTGRAELALSLGRAALLGFSALIVAIGGRAIPAFIDNWRRGIGAPGRPIPSQPRRRLLVLGLIGLALLGAAFPSPGAGLDRLVGASLLGAALGLVWMIAGWRPVAACRNPLLAGLILGFSWVPVGLAAVGLDRIWLGVIPPGDAVHALTIGAMAGLIMAIAGRASARRIDGTLVAGRGFAWGIGLIWLAAVCRLVAGVFPALREAFVSGAAGLWCLAWLVFLSGFAPSVLGPVIRPVLSGARRAGDGSDPLGGG